MNLAPLNRRFLLLLGLVSSLGLSGCLQPETDSPEAGKDSRLEDPGRRAGASSTTNWPQELGGGDEVAWTCDTNITLIFKIFGIPVPGGLSGKLSFYKAGEIPAIYVPKTVEMPFTSQNTILITPAWMDSLDADRDTVGFTLAVETGGKDHCYLLGFAYLRDKRRFSATVFPTGPQDSAVLTELRYSFKGKLADGFFLPPAPAQGFSELSYYIPGTPFFWKAELGDSLSLGPIPKGNFPLRLLRVTGAGAGKPGSAVEVFEVIGDTLKGETKFRLGERFFLGSSPVTLSLRKPGQP